jgi:acetyltransferase-like isoleucine patch superfamily enzyme
MSTKREKSEMLNVFDRLLYRFLEACVDIMPTRLAKFIALYYTDARVRKLYSQHVGVVMGEGTYANLGMKVVPNDHKVCVLIGCNTSIAPNVTFVCSSSPNNGAEINGLDYVKNHLVKSADIIVGDEVWIGANVTILPGVTVGRCSVIGAGSVVMEDVEPYSVYAGIPARKIRDLVSGERVK